MANLKLADANDEQIKKQFPAVFERANKTDAKPKDVEALRAMLSAHGDLKLWRNVTGIMAAAEDQLLRTPALPRGGALCWKERLESLREEMGGADAPPVERMLIQHAALCWLRLGLVESDHAGRTGGDHTYASGVYWDKRLSAAQRRFSRAVESLAQVRKLSAEAERARRGASAASARTLKALTG